jgi:hypothetical protein
MKTATKWFFIGLVFLLALSKILLTSHIALALPTGPTITYISNSSASSSLQNRSQDEKGTITTILLSANQQDYKWKAYVGNVTGKVALDDANGRTIYDWDLGTSQGGKVIVSRFSNINWNNIACATQATIDNEETLVGMSLTAADNINSTFLNTTHRSFLVGVIPISGCRSTATYVNDASQVVNSTARFQEILLRDTSNGNLLYTTLMESAQNGFDNQPHDFQLLVAENESATVPTPYFFWVELG